MRGEKISKKEKKKKEINNKKKKKTGTSSLIVEPFLRPPIKVNQISGTECFHQLSLAKHKQEDTSEI